MKIVIQNVLWLLVFVAYQYICLASNKINIGVFFDHSDLEPEIYLNTTLSKKNAYNRLANYEATIKRISGTHDCFNVSKMLCDVISKDNGVAAIIGPEGEATSDTLQSFCANFDLPYISTTWRSVPSTAVTVLNLFPRPDLFQEALAEIVRSLQWKSFVIIYEDEEGLVKLQEVLKLQVYDAKDKRNNILLKQLGSGADYKPVLKEVKNLNENNIILDCQTDKIMPILKYAQKLDILNLQFNYFITSLDAHTLQNEFTKLKSSANITTIRLFDDNDEGVKDKHHFKTESLLFHDALNLLTESITDLRRTDNKITTNRVNCSQSVRSGIGHRIVTNIKMSDYYQIASGPLKFDDTGNRIDFNLHAVDILHDNAVIATWNAESGVLNLTRSSSTISNAVLNNMQGMTIIVASRLGEPYLMRKTPENGEILESNARYEGYSMDLIEEISNILNITFLFKLVPDNKYGNWDETQRRWNGLVGELLERRAHLAICDLTITHQRRAVVDFSMPFMTLGIGILYRKEGKKPIDMFAFLDPFSIEVWMYTATLYLIISVVLYFISRLTPGDWENPHPCEENPEELENIWDIKNCLWLTLGSIMTQGCDILPKGISSRLAVSMWWFFSLIMTSSYTANLAAFLTKDRMEPSIESAEALSKQTKIKYGAVQGGSTQAFFRDSNFSTYQRMWMNMQQARPSVFEKSNADGVHRVRVSGGSYAFLMESTQIEYEMETKCDLRRVGGALDTKSYGIAMPMNSPYRSAINKAILTLQETGKLAALKRKWWKGMRKEPSCGELDPDEVSDGAELALANIGGVFFVLGIGVSGAFILAIGEFLWNVRSVSVEEHMTFLDALKVELKFACNIWVTKKRAKPVVSESSGSSGRSDKTENVPLSPTYSNTSKST